MKKSLELLEDEFESSCSITPEFRRFARTFKREFKKLLIELGAEKIEIEKGHFYLYGFFTIKKQIYYFNIGDVRWDKGSMLIRTAESYEDFTGGSNGYVKMDNEFVEYLKRYLCL